MSDVVLHQFPPMGGMPSLSPFCVKVQLALHIKAIPFGVANTMFAGRVSAVGQLPVLRVGAEDIVDSSAILRELDRRWPDTPRLFPADPALAADVHLLEDWADEALYWHGVYAKFCVDEAWARYAPEFRRALGPALGAIGAVVARRETVGKARAQGVARRARADVDADFDRHLDALEARLGDRRAFVGASISAADLAVTAMLVPLTTGYTPAQGERIARRVRLSAHLARVMTEAKIG